MFFSFLFFFFKQKTAYEMRISDWSSDVCSSDLLMTAVSPNLEALKKEGETGRKKINQYTRYLTVLLAAVQAFGIATGMESLPGARGPAVIDPGIFFRGTGRGSCRERVCQSV